MRHELLGVGIAFTCAVPKKRRGRFSQIRERSRLAIARPRLNNRYAMFECIADERIDARTDERMAGQTRRIEFGVKNHAIAIHRLEDNTRHTVCQKVDTANQT